MTFLTIFIIALGISAFLSAAEMAFVSVNALKLRQHADTGDARARKIMLLTEDPQHFLSAILIGNNITNIAATASLAYIFEIYFGIHNEWIVTCFAAPILIILGEMVPKDYGRMHSDDFLLHHAGLLTWTAKLFHWPVVLILQMMESVLGRFKTFTSKDIFVSEKEFRMLIEESVKTGVLDDHEKQLINTILDFERIRLTSVMIPIAEASKLDIGSRVQDVKAEAKRTRAPMVLIYEETPSIVVGIVYVYDVLFEPDDQKPLKEFLRSPIFLAGNISVEKAFLTLQQKRQSYAVVMNEVSDAVGVAPIERLVQT